MTLNDRITIQEGLDNRLSIRTIAKSIGKTSSTVLREINKHKFIKGKRRPDLLDECAHKRGCGIFHLCKDVKCTSPCSTCELCKGTAAEKISAAILYCFLSEIKIIYIRCIVCTG